VRPLRPATAVLTVDAVRRLEADAMPQLPEGGLMQRAATALAVEAGAMLREIRGRVTGSRVVLLVGAGNNGGDALYAGARLASRGARVDALLVTDRIHAHGAAALSHAGGRLRDVALGDVRAAELVAGADLVVDGILGIGGRGALREPAAWLAAVARETDVAVLAVDLPSGVDAGTGAVADRDAVVHADRTVTFGCLKPGLLLGDGALLTGDLAVVDIGLALDGAGVEEVVVRIDDDSAADDLALPGALDDKYSRGVVGVSAGSEVYPGAAVLATAGARHGLAGYVRYVGHAHEQVVGRWPDVVARPGRVGNAGRTQCWVVGSGRGVDEDARLAVLDAVALVVPLVLDADALTLIADDAEVRAAVAARTGVTVLTPHAGEFARLAGSPVGDDRVVAARALARDLRAVVLLKGSATVVAAPGGEAYVAVSAPAELATAGSGDVLAGLLGSLLAHHEARTPLRPADAARLAAVAAHVHGVAGALAVRDGRTITALDVAAALPEAVARIRRAAAG
jgi:hydroxyethylthiazole kinase-like uncharacterized protein yjeF